jgi:hypothetical protein
MRAALLFTVWTAFCMVLAIAGFLVVFDLLGNTDGLRFEPLDQSTIYNIGFFGLCAVPAGAIAGLGWWLLHRNSYKPKWWAYGLFAIAVVIVNHYLIFGVLSHSFWESDYLAQLEELSLLLMLHGWLSVPVALIGTALFVVFYRKRLAPSGD